MESQEFNRVYSFRILEKLKVFAFLASIIWIAHFWHYASFGLYADDFYRVGRAIDGDFVGILRNIFDLFLMRYGQGRFLHDGLIILFSYLGLKLGGLSFIYWIGYAIVTTNTFLFYLLLRRLYNQQFFALTGALAFCLFPADTTKVFLTHSLGIWPSLTFLLIASHCYLSGRKKLSYFFILGSMFCYEIFFPLFLAAPLLKKKWDSRLIREFLQHTLILGGIFVFVVIIRKLTGESRATDITFLLAIRTSIGNMLVGPIVSVGMFLYRSIQGWLRLDVELVLFIPICFVGFTWMLYRFQLDNSAISLSFRPFRSKKSILTQNLVRLTLLGLIMLVLAYPLTLNPAPSYNVWAITGRASRIHTAAIVGASILCACACSAILLVVSTQKAKRRLATMGLAVFFTGLVGFGLTVQQDYRISWEYQKAFFTDVIRLCPDMTDGTVILVEKTTNLKRTKHAPDYEGTSSNVVLRRIYQFPRSWEPPRVYKLKPGWSNEIVSDENLFDLNYSTVGFIPSSFYTKVKSINVILLEVENGQLTRRTKPLIINGQEFPLKEKSSSEFPPFQKGYLYDYLIISPEEDTVDYIKNI